ncbi:MAG TPA: hypothetical protein VF466_04330 [Candidatus Saccharimonadales bacterium]
MTMTEQLPLRPSVPQPVEATPDAGQALAPYDPASTALVPFNRNSDGYVAVPGAAAPGRNPYGWIDTRRDNLDSVAASSSERALRLIRGEGPPPPTAAVLLERAREEELAELAAATDRATTAAHAAAAALFGDTDGAGLFAEVSATVLGDRPVGAIVPDPNALLAQAHAEGRLIIGGQIVTDEALEYALVAEVSDEYRFAAGALAAMSPERGQERSELEQYLFSLEDKLAALLAQVQINPDSLERVAPPPVAPEAAPAGDGLTSDFTGYQSVMADVPTPESLIATPAETQQPMDPTEFEERMAALNRERVALESAIHNDDTAHNLDPAERQRLQARLTMVVTLTQGLLIRNSSAGSGEASGNETERMQMLERILSGLRRL